MTYIPRRTLGVRALDAALASAFNALFVSRALALALCALLIGSVGPGNAMPSLDGGQWLNSSPFSANELRGKVTLVDFWEYTCINCLRTLPYLREWYKRYHRYGFEIIGVQTPEFQFSGEEPQVEAAIKRLQIAWPVLLDSRRTVWNRYGVNLWPTEFLFDSSGKLLATHLGEGNYPNEEREIQNALKAIHPGTSFPEPMALLPQDSYDKPGAVCYPQSPELVVERTPIANAPKFGDPSADLDYVDRAAHKDGLMYLEGYWHATREAVVFGGGNGAFVLPYHAIEVAVVMTPPKHPSRVVVEQDGKPIAREDAGADVKYDAQGESFVDVDAERSYQVIVNKRFAEHELRLKPLESGIAIYDVAFESCEVPR